MNNFEFEMNTLVRPRTAKAHAEALRSKRDSRAEVDCTHDRSDSNAFYVTDGAVIIGPVDRELLVRGIHAGRIPADAGVWRSGWDRWHPVRECAITTATSCAAQSQDGVSIAMDEDRSSGVQMTPVDAECACLADAGDLKHAATIFLSLCAAATKAECGWVHMVSRLAGGAMVTVEGIGPRAVFGVGRTVHPSDHALRAAREGRAVLSEPIPGVVGSATAARILSTGIAPVSVLMTPVLCVGQLIVMLEIGMASRATGFALDDASRVLGMAREFGIIARKRAWHR